jgi:hypothetical protein
MDQLNGTLLSVAHSSALELSVDFALCRSRGHRDPGLRGDACDVAPSPPRHSREPWRVPLLRLLLVL